MDTVCREYQGFRNEHGYGRRNRRRADGTIESKYVHRWVIETLGEDQFGTKWDPKLKVLHLCDNPACFRFDHLRLGTQADNQADMKAKLRARTRPNAPNRQPAPKPGALAGRSHCKHGHPYTPDNTCTDRRGWRSCRTCRRDSDRRRRAR